MTWRDRYQRASFRGVQFFVLAADSAFGRRNVVHEYPQRDVPYVEDLGLRARGFRLEAVLIGADYMAARDALVAAIEEPGPGTLVHPYLGEQLVAVEDCTLRESTVAGGMCTFSLAFVLAGERREPAAATGTPQALVSAADRAAAQAQADFESHYVLARKPAYLAEAASQILTDALATMQRVAGSVQAKADQVAALAREVKGINAQITTLIYVPASAAQALVSNLKLLVREVAVAPREAIGLARVFFRFGSELPNVPQTTASRVQQASNQSAMTALARVTGLAEAARALAALEFDSYTDAVLLRDELLGVADELEDDAALSDELFAALAGLRSAVVRDVAERGADLARLVAYTPQATVPALVVAYGLYEDAARDAQIVARNAIAHPGFVPGGVPLEVLTDG